MITINQKELTIIPNDQSLSKRGKMSVDKVIISSIIDSIAHHSSLIKILESLHVLKIIIFYKLLLDNEYK